MGIFFGLAVEYVWLAAWAKPSPSPFLSVFLTLGVNRMGVRLEVLEPCQGYSFIPSVGR